MGLLKRWRDGKQLRAKAKSDPAVRESWVRRHDAIFTGLQVPGVGPNICEPSSWRAMFEEFEGGPPCRQELEWWRTACVMKQSITCPPAWFPAIAAMIDAIDAMLPDAADGPSSESYP